jgi:predicted nucleic acid-binding protein
LLSIALSGGADYLVSVDVGHVLVLKKVGRTRIYNPDRFLRQLGHRR